MAKKKKGRLFINIRILVELVAVVMIWRGVWLLLDTYLFPLSPATSAILGIVIGVIVLLVDDWLLEEINEWIK